MAHAGHRTGLWESKAGAVAYRDWLAMSIQPASVELEGYIVTLLAGLKCLSGKRRLELAARLGGEPGGARRLASPRHGCRRP
jgi:hypothetical protein